MKQALSYGQINPALPTRNHHKLHSDDNQLGYNAQSNKLDFRENPMRIPSVKFNEGAYPLNNDDFNLYKNKN